MAEKEKAIPGRAIALAAAGLAVIGGFLLFGGGDETPAARGEAEPSASGGSSRPESVWSPFDHEDDTTTSWPQTPGGSRSPSSTPSPQPTSTWEPTPVPTSATAPPTDAPPDPHTHDTTVTQDQVDAGPTPEFDHDFDVEVSDEAEVVTRQTAWAWLSARLEKELWTYLELIEYGVLEVADDETGEATTVAVELGFSGVTGLGQIGVGKIATVWLQVEDDGSWKVTGYRAGALRDDSD